MPGPLTSFEIQIEAAIQQYDELTAEQRAKVLTQHANRLRTDD